MKLMNKIILCAILLLPIMLLEANRASSIENRGSTPYSVKNITDGDSVDFYAEFSPDGKQIVFSSKNGEPEKGDFTHTYGSYWNLWIMDADGGNRRKLTEGKISDMAPVFTPDGKKIIFSSNRGGGTWDLWSLRPDGSGLSRLTKWRWSEFAPRPSSDGKEIVFIANKEGLASVWAMSIDGSNARRLTSGGFGDYFPLMNPDGKDIVFVSTRLGNGDIWTIDTEGKNYRRLTYEDYPEFSPAWSPDGKKIAYVSREGGKFDIWVMDRDGRHKQRITKGISGGNWDSRFSMRKVLETAGYYHLAWHPDGNKIVFTTWDSEQKTEDRGQKTALRQAQGVSLPLAKGAGGIKKSQIKKGTRISILEFDTNKLNEMTEEMPPTPEYTLIGEQELTKGNWEDFAPSFNPDGKSLVFASNRKGNWDIWKMGMSDLGMGVNNGKPEQVTESPADEIAPVFSPDGKKIAFLKENGRKGEWVNGSKKIQNPKSKISNRQYSLWIMNTDGSKARQLTEDISVLSFPAWNPSGEEISFVTEGSKGPEIWSHNVVDVSRKRIASIMSKNPVHPVNPVKKNIRENHQSEIGNASAVSLPKYGSKIRPYDRLEAKNLKLEYPFKEFLYRIDYNAVGDRIVFESIRSGNAEIWTMGRDGKDLAQLTSGEGPYWNPVFSPNGKKIAYTTKKSGGLASHNWVNYNIWLADAKTGKESLITGEEQTDWNPAWSPDGKKIAYVTNRSGEFKHFSIWMLYLK